MFGHSEQPVADQPHWPQNDVLDNSFAVVLTVADKEKSPEQLPGRVVEAAAVGGISATSAGQHVKGSVICCAVFH